jgi:hypothetical protein
LSLLADRGLSMWAISVATGTPAAPQFTPDGRGLFPA